MKEYFSREDLCFVSGRFKPDLWLEMVFSPSRRLEFRLQVGVKTPCG